MALPNDPDGPVAPASPPDPASPKGHASPATGDGGPGAGGGGPSMIDPDLLARAHAVGDVPLADRADAFDELNRDVVAALRGIEQA